MKQIDSIETRHMKQAKIQEAEKKRLNVTIK